MRLTFTNGEVRVYDMAPIIDQGGVFTQLRNDAAFQSVRSRYGAVQWAGGQDLCPHTLYEDSIPEGAKMAVREPAPRYRTTKRGAKSIRATP